MRASLQHVLFVPRRQHIWEPSIKHESVMIDGKLNGWFFNNYPGKKIILFCHGNYGNISYNEFVIELCDKQELNLFIFDYSGFGKSLGTPDQLTLCQDGLLAFDFLIQNHHYHPEDILLWGMSMGGAVATAVACNRKCFALILLSTFSSLDDIFIDTYSGKMIRGLMYFISLLFDTMPSKTRIKNVTCPIVVMHSLQDGLIPFSNAERLFASIPHISKKIIQIGGTHINAQISPTQLAEALSFCCIDGSQCFRCIETLNKISTAQVNLREKEIKLFGYSSF